MIKQRHFDSTSAYFIDPDGDLHELKALDDIQIEENVGLFTNSYRIVVYWKDGSYLELERDCFLEAAKCRTELINTLCKEITNL